MVRGGEREGALYRALPWRATGAERIIGELALGVVYGLQLVVPEFQGVLDRLIVPELQGVRDRLLVVTELERVEDRLVVTELQSVEDWTLVVPELQGVVDELELGSALGLIVVRVAQRVMIQRAGRGDRRSLCRP